MSGICRSRSDGNDTRSDGSETRTGASELQIRQTMIGRSFFAVVGTFFSITPALVYLVAGWQPSTSTRSTPARSSRSRRCNRGRSSRWARCCRCRPRSRAVRLVRPHLRVPRSAARHRGRPERLDASEVAGTVEPATSASATRSARIKRPRSRRPISRTRTRHRGVDPRPGLDAHRERTLAALVGRGGRQDDHLPRAAPVRRAAWVGHDRWNTAVGHRARSLGDVIGVVTQETYLFHTTIRATAVAAPRPAGRAEAAARPRTSTTASQSCPTATTRWWERGYKLGRGEQRLAIARVILGTS